MPEELKQENKEAEEEKSQARKDYEEGLEFMKKDELPQAANLFHNALIGFEQDGDTAGIANAADKLGDICSERRDFDNAMKHYERVHEICQKEGDGVSLFALDKKKADLHARCGKFDQAINMYLDIIDEYNVMRNPKGTIDTLEKLAQVYIDKGEREMAADCYRTAASIHKNFKHNRHAELYLRKADEIFSKN